MTIFYDNVGSPSQLGSDLQQFSSNGWAFSDGRTHWDGLNAVGVLQYAFSYLDLIVHAGVLTVAWVEPQWNGSVSLARGPYVAQWNGSSWVMLGGEVEPSNTAVDINYPSPTFGQFNITAAIGTRWRPARPKLASDGVNLFCGYTIQEVALGPNNPPAGATDPTGATINVGDYTKWAPRKAYVRRWNGSTWDLYADLPALTFNNSTATNNTSPVGNTSTIAGRITDLALCASPNQGGVCYLGLEEQGPNATIERYVSSGTNFWAPNAVYLQVGRYDGSSTSGIVTNVLSLSNPSFVTGSQTALQPNIQASQMISLGNENGAMVFWDDNTSSTGLGTKMTAVDTNTLKQSNGSVSGVNETGPQITYNPLVGVYYMNQAYPSPFGNQAQVIANGSTGFAHGWDGNFTASGSYQLLTMIADRNNVWGVHYIITGTATGISNHLMHYHRYCFDTAGGSLDDKGYCTPSSTTQRLSGCPVVKVIGDTLYTAAPVYNSTNNAVDLKIQVYSAAISRNSQSCGGTAPAVTAKAWCQLV